MKKIRKIIFIFCLLVNFDASAMLLHPFGDPLEGLTPQQRETFRKIIGKLLMSLDTQKIVDADDDEEASKEVAPSVLPLNLLDLKLSPYPGILNAEHVLLIPLLPENWEVFSKAKEFYSGKKIRKKLKISREELGEVFLTNVQEAHLSKFQACWSLHTRKGLCGFIHVFCTEATKACDNYIGVHFFNFAPADDEDLNSFSCAFYDGQKVALTYIQSNLESADRDELKRESFKDKKNYLRYLKSISDFLE